MPVYMVDAATTVIITSNIMKATYTITPINAPFAHDFALRGYSPCHTKYRMRPISGNKKHKNANPPLRASFTAL